MSEPGEEVERLADLPEMHGYFWFHVTRAEIQEHLGDHAGSLSALAAAHAQARTSAQAGIVRQKIDAIERARSEPSS